MILAAALVVLWIFGGLALFIIGVALGVWHGYTERKRLEDELHAEHTNLLLAEQGLRKLSKEYDDLKFWEFVSEEEVR